MWPSNLDFSEFGAHAPDGVNLKGNNRNKESREGTALLVVNIKRRDFLGEIILLNYNYNVSDFQDRILVIL